MNDFHSFIFPRAKCKMAVKYGEKGARAFLRGIQKLYVGFQRERAGKDDDISIWPISSRPQADFGIWTNQNEDRDKRIFGSIGL